MRKGIRNTKREKSDGSVGLGHAIAAAHRHRDSFSNPGARTGFGQLNLINTTEYPLTRLTQDWQTLTSIFRSSWIVQKVCSVIPEDAMNDLTIEAPELDQDRLDQLNRAIVKTDVRMKIIEAFKWARLYGGAAGIIMLDGNDEDLERPLRVRDILPGSFRGIYVVDRWSGIYPSTELVSNHRSRDFGTPKYYEVRDESGVIAYRVHHSRVLRFTGEKMPFYEEIAEQYWGTSAIEAMFDDLVRRDNITHNIANLTFKACLSVYEIENLDQVFASASANVQRRMYSMIQAMSILESNLGVKLVNKGDSVQQLQYSFGGLPEGLDGAMLDVAGSTGIPATRLFGRSPAGMNSTGESDMLNYRQTLATQRAIHIVPALEKLAPIVAMSVLGEVPDGIEFKLPPLMELTPNEKAEIVDKQSGYLERLFQAGVIPADTLLTGVRNAQNDVGIVSTITDENVDAVKNKYLKDLQPQADPFGGVFNGGETGEPNAEENVEVNEVNGGGETESNT